ncbi:hypothetical protein G7K_3967-t1 [Saitoella complicata NRRL Y-17804]|uniref:Uncharacterized protein n=2 Tax=Saitoella complicata (strain BCRC 22490 / CBS 7301 / JCM 7358 / NBRC 10748 / NRRL Y-17804) TaxID=698492 RepID=A0A0E9NJ02_SAICN|nr:hypothetical protein G7K_3967-t1 [Saitoella complicata NRRL Y-17804]
MPSLLGLLTGKDKEKDRDKTKNGERKDKPVIIRAGRGGAGNIRRERSPAPTSPTIPQSPSSPAFQSPSKKPQHGVLTPHKPVRVSIGRGGSGNLFPESQVAAGEEDEVFEEDEPALRRVMTNTSNNSKASSRDEVVRTGRGGAGNIKRGPTPKGERKSEEGVVLEGKPQARRRRSSGWSFLSSSSIHSHSDADTHPQHQGEGGGSHHLGPRPRKISHSRPSADAAAVPTLAHTSTTQSEDADALMPLPTEDSDTQTHTHARARVGYSLTNAVTRDGGVVVDLAPSALTPTLTPATNPMEGVRPVARRVGSSESAGSGNRAPGPGHVKRGMFGGGGRGSGEWEHAIADEDDGHGAGGERGGVRGLMGRLRRWSTNESVRRE